MKLTPEQVKTLQNIIFAEAAGGSPDEIKAVASTFITNANSKGADKAFNMSSAYRKQSPQYVKADTGTLTPYEQKVYDQHGQILNSLIVDPTQVQPFTHFENVQQYGEPSWAKSLTNYQDIGRQRFYQEKPKAPHYAR